MRGDHKRSKKPWHTHTHMQNKQIHPRRVQQLFCKETVRRSPRCPKASGGMMASACRDSALKGFVLQELNCCLEWFIRAYHNANPVLQGNIGETVCELCKPPYTARVNIVSHLPAGASGEATRSRCLHGPAEELTHRCKSTVPSMFRFRTGDEGVGRNLAGCSRPTCNKSTTMFCPAAVFWGL